MGKKGVTKLKKVESASAVKDNPSGSIIFPTKIIL